MMRNVSVGDEAVIKCSAVIELIPRAEDVSNAVKMKSLIPDLFSEFNLKSNKTQSLFLENSKGLIHKVVADVFCLYYKR